MSTETLSHPVDEGAREHRVYRLSADLRARMRARREALGQTVGQFVVYAVGSELPALAAELAELLPPDGGDTRAARLPFPPAVLDAVRAAARATGISGTRLVTACLLRAAGRRRRRKVEGLAPAGSENEPTARDEA